MSKPRASVLCGIVLLLAAVTVAVWLPVRRNAFVTYDDPAYVTENPHVLAGLTPESLVWAFTDTSTGNWHPVTWISHMLDCELFGLRPGPHHLVSLALHVANACLLFLLLAVTTGSAGRSLFVAVAFAVHPLHVESVAWIAERKDLLSTFFGLLTLAAWLGWVRAPNPPRYLLVLVLYALSLASKPMLVTLPCLLLLLDIWPLRRVRLLAEKAPLFALALGSSVAAIATQHRSGSVASLDSIGIGSRMANALVSYVLYLRDALVPRNLNVLYPYPARGYSAVVLLACALFLVLVTIFSVRAVGSRPWLTVGWLWYLVTLLPVIGLIQIGVQARADRYTYVPLIGPFLMMAWSLPESLAHRVRSRRLQPLLAVLGVVLVLAWSVAARAQMGYWRDSVQLYTRALSVEAHNPEIQYNLADSLAESGALEQAVEHYRAALADDPSYAEAHNNLGNALRRMGRLEEAVSEYKAALAIDARSALFHDNLGLVLAQQGRLTEAVAHYVEALRLNPSSTGARTNLARALHGLGRLDEARREYQHVLRIDPGHVDAAYGMGNVLADMGRLEEAVASYERALQVRPDNAAAHMRLALALALMGRPEDARTHRCLAIRLDPLSEQRLLTARDGAPDGPPLGAMEMFRAPCDAAPAPAPEDPGKTAIQR